ncbi:apolipoprotein N-acyltransferase [Luteimonas saliphila]|uniref:apolipoprotein N-acyltransferase n=1 Tax=Luteimonas saliphila TaxID=2804919 RepID=UPI00192D282E|nr:nitrilase-related carbon-nitrogen hydrolase [Luteimonas saliphila]
MDSGTDHLSPMVAAVAVTLTALGWWFGTALQPLWWAASLAPLPLLAVALRMRARWAALATFVAFALGGLNLWHYLHDVIRLPLAVVLQAISMPALAMIPVVLLFRALARRGWLLAATFSVPASATGLAWLSARLSPHGTFGNIAYTQMDAVPVLQVAALVGLWGVGFLVWLGPSMLAAAFAAPGSPRQRASALLAGACVLALALGLGAWRLQPDAASSRVRVALLSVGGDGSHSADLDAEAGRRLLARYVEEIERIASGDDVDVVVMPESALLVRSHAIAPLQSLADRHGVRIVIGAEDHTDPARKRNSALVFDPGTPMPAAYHKRHLIPGLEARYTPGDTRIMLGGAPATGVSICKDLDFTATARDHAARGTQLLLVPAWDFDVDAWLHGRMAVMRGVEGGFAIARAARDGDLTLSDDRGRVLAEASAVGADGPVSLVADLPLRATRTPYRLWGDAFGPACLLLAGLLASSLLLGRARGR